MAATLSIILPPDVPPERFVDLAQAAERAGLEEVWLWEDCFAQAGLGPSAAVLAATSRIRVGLGLMPVPLRNVALTAMEISALARMFPGRFLPGIGHGVLEWMGQAGVRARSPLTLLREQATALRALLAGEEVSVQGEYVRLDRVQLRWPPEQVPPLLIGAGRPRTLALAGELGDGVILAGDDGPEAETAGARAALDARAGAGVDAPYEVIEFTSIAADAGVDDVRRLAAAYPLATRITILALAPDGTPDRGDRIEALIARVAAAAA
ncbi:LLM class flavin-dependent oxidoreductase [Agrococcus terreus]|uniref:LLM class flavin-dependent oxidoreductase n=1 Tax=Agrococcus terreus TaxID=574649 RepID=UPI00384E2A9C